MERRKFVMGLGALAAGGSAAVGSGAFTTASIPREGDINVANDDNAFIQLEAGGARGVQDRVGKEGGELYIDFDESASGSGVNDDSRYQLGAMNDSALGDGIDFDSLYDSDTTPSAEGAGEPYVESSDADQSAFVIRNMSGQTLDIQIGLNTDSDNTGATVYLQGKATDISGDDGSVGTDDSSQLDGATATNTGVLDLDDLEDEEQAQDAPKEALSFNNVNDPDEAIPAGESVYVSIQVDTRDDETSDGTSLAEELVVSANEAADPGVE